MIYHIDHTERTGSTKGNCMSRNDEQNLVGLGLGPSGDAQPKAPFRGPPLKGWAVFGWSAMTQATSPDRSRFTRTKTVHRPRRIR
jgi:hypothetical protein